MRPDVETRWPRGLRAPQAASYLGIGESKFRELVNSGKLPRPARIDGCVVWDRLALDEAFEAFAEQTSANPWDED